MIAVHDDGDDEVDVNGDDGNGGHHHHHHTYE